MFQQYSELQCKFLTLPQISKSSCSVCLTTGIRGSGTIKMRKLGPVFTGRQSDRSLRGMVPLPLWLGSKICAFPTHGFGPVSRCLRLGRVHGVLEKQVVASSIQGQHRCSNVARVVANVQTQCCKPI